MFVIQDSLGNIAEAEDMDAAVTAAKQLWEDAEGKGGTITISNRANKGELQMDLQTIITVANETMGWGHITELAEE